MSLTLCDTPNTAHCELQLPEASSNWRSDTSDRLRLGLWSAVVQALDESGLPYAILGAPHRPLDLTESDLDFVVRAADFNIVPQLLATAANSIGGYLIQAIRHETTAIYFAIARQEGEAVAFVNPDCTTDYRRRGRLWLSADELLSERARTPAGFFRPSPDVDFTYYLVKQVLKQVLTHAQWRKLTTLYRSTVRPHYALSLWPPETQDEIVRALGQSKAAVFRNLVPRLSAELRRTPYRQSLPDRTSHVAAELARIAERAIHPTGLFVRITNGGLEDRLWLAYQLAHALAPAFRRTWVPQRRSSVGVWRALIASTLVVAPEETGIAYGGIRVRWELAMTPAENLQRAIAAVISHLSRRTGLRLGLREPQGFAIEPDAEVRAY